MPVCLLQIATNQKLLYDKEHKHVLMFFLTGSERKSAMQLFSMQPSFCRQWLEGLRRVAKYVSMLAGFVLLIKYGFPGAVYVLLQVAIYLVALASFLVAILAVVPGIPFAVRLWRSQHEFANFAILVVTFAPFWGTALGMMAGGLLGRLSGEFMVIDLPGP